MDPDTAKAPLNQSGSHMLLPCTQNALPALPTVGTVPHRDKLSPTTDAAAVPGQVAACESTAPEAARNPDSHLLPNTKSTASLRALVNDQLRRTTIRKLNLQPRIASPTTPHLIGPRPRPRPLGSHPVVPGRPVLNPDNYLFELISKPAPDRAILSEATLPPADHTSFPLFDHDWFARRSSNWPKEEIQSAHAVRLLRPKAVQVTATSKFQAAREKPSVAPSSSLSVRPPPSTPPVPPPHILPLPLPSPYKHLNDARPFQGRPRSSAVADLDTEPPALATMNGMNGANMGVGMVGPTPAGHQQELSHIYGMVDDLSSQLAENRRVLEEVVSLVGRIRARARHQNLPNQDVIAGADDPSTTENLDRLISILSETLEKALHERDANSELLQQYANVMANMVRQAHDHKSRTVTDVSSWHRSYRQQLAEAREENSRLREQIWDVQERAGRLNDSVRQFRTGYDAEPARYEARVENIALRQEVRFWKRMAMPDVPEDDPMWSDDDDLIDPAETTRLAEVERAAAAMAASQHLAAQEEEENQLKEDERRVLEAAGDSSGGGAGADGAGDAAGLTAQGPQGGAGGPGGRGVLVQREGETS